MGDGQEGPPARWTSGGNEARLERRVQTRAASGTTAYSGAAGPRKCPSQDEAGGMLQCHTARTRQHRLPRKKGRPVFSGLAVLHDSEVLPLEIRAWILSVQPCSLASATFWGDQGRVLPSVTQFSTSRDGGPPSWACSWPKGFSVNPQSSSKIS